MENSDVHQSENMAEAAVETPAARFFCHRCTLEVSPVLPDYKCPRCQSGFIEELTQNPEPSEESDDDAYYPFSNEGNDDADPTNQISEYLESHRHLRLTLWNMLSAMRQDDGNLGNGSQAQESRDSRYSRPGPSRRSRFNRIPPRRSQDLNTARERTEGFLHQLVSSLSENAGLVPNASFPVFLNLHSNPGDYAWGRGGWNAIITQLINQLDGTGPPPLPKEKIDEIPSVNICQEQVDKNLQCTVCMEDFKLDESVKMLSCDHHFHNGCIIPWLELHGTCPICRKLLNDSSSQENSQSNSQNSSNDTEIMDTSLPQGSTRINFADRSFNYTPQSDSSIYDFHEEFD